MPEKEVKETFIQSLYFLGLVLAVSVILWLPEFLLGGAEVYREVLLGVFQVGLLVFSLFMGISLFSGDVRNGGLEYLLTLPLSRRQLLTVKLLPRLGMLLLCFGVYRLLMVLTGITPDSTRIAPLMSGGGLLFLCFALFMIGLPFSVSRGSIVVSAMGALLSSALYLGVVHLIFPVAAILKKSGAGHIYSYLKGGQDVPSYMYFDYIYTLLQGGQEKIPVYMYFAVFTLLGTFIFAFVRAFRVFDLGPVRTFTRRYLKIFVPACLLLLTVSVGWAYLDIHPTVKRYYLTSNRQLLEYDDFSTRVHHRDGVSRMRRDGSFWFFNPLDKGDYIYTVFYSKKVKQMVRFNPANLDAPPEVVYDAGPDASIGREYAFGDRVAMLEGRRSGGRKRYSLVVVRPKTGMTQKIPLPENFTGGLFYQAIIGAGEMDGKVFWLLSHTDSRKGRLVYRVWQTGGVLPLTESLTDPLYVRDMLITTDRRTIKLDRLTPGGIEPVRRLPRPRGFRFQLRSPKGRGLSPTGAIYGGTNVSGKPHQWVTISRLDLDTLEMEEIKPMENMRGYFVYSHPDQWYYVRFENASPRGALVLKSLYRLDGAAPYHPRLIKEFEPLDIMDREGGNYFRLFDGGFVAKRKGKTTVHALPDLGEMTYPGLN